MSVVIPLLRDLQGPWVSLQIEFVDGGSTTEAVEAYPFISVTDLKRIIWMKRDGDPRWAPERTFLGIRTETGFRPIEFHWPSSVSTILPDPLVERTPHPALVDSRGNRKPVHPTMIGGLILEAALAPELLASADLPRITAICLSALGTEEPVPALFGGFYQLYFPWLKEAAAVVTAETETAAITLAYGLAVPYTLDRKRRIGVVQEALAAGVAGDAVTMTSMVRLRWTLPAAARPASLEQFFYELPATELMPFLRFFPAAGSTPLLKLALHPDGTPFISNEKVLSRFLNIPAPAGTATILAKIPVGTGPALTMYIFEDGSSDVTLEVPQRGSTYIASVAADAEELLHTIITDLGAPITHPILRDLHATYSWSHPDPTHGSGLSATDLRKRITTLTPFLEAGTTDPQAIAVFKWRAVSNYESESAMFAFITQLALDLGGDYDPEDGLTAASKYATELSKQFGIKVSEAEGVIERWLERKAHAVAPTTATGFLAVPKHSAGTSVAIKGAYPDYSLEIQGADSFTDVQRLASVVGVLLGSPTTSLSAPAPIIQEIAAAVVADDAEEEEELDEETKALLAQLGDLGIGHDEGGEAEAAEAEDAVAVAPLPDVVATPDCSVKQWAADDQPLNDLSKYYWAKLSKLDPMLFSYGDTTKTGEDAKKPNTYCRRCGSVGGRQPDIITLKQYSRIKRCYEGRVRFIDLPPRTPEDLPPPKKKGTDFITDPETGLPYWSVYGYESKTRRGDFLYLLCAEYWCAKPSCDLPILRSEYEGTVGRGGFTKPPNTCPFCSGRPIQDMKHPAFGESIIIRRKKETIPYQRFIGFIREVTHPKNYEFPCCGVKPTLIEKYLDGVAAGTYVFPSDLDVKAEIVAETKVKDKVVYEEIFNSMQKQYILDSDKTLVAGKIGILPPLLDAFFGQNSPEAIKQAGIRTTFREGAVLFLHVGVDTQALTPGLNLFGGLAPLLGFNTAEECKMALIERISPRAFESANYGTLVHEFAAKADLSESSIAKSLPDFAAKYGYRIENRPHLIRLYRAYVAFISYLSDDRTPKKLRHLEHLLSQPGRGRSLLLVVLEQTGGEIDVACPAFGLVEGAETPVSFLWHDKRDDSWEPIILYNGTKEAVRYFGQRDTAVPAAQRSAIAQWLRTWRNQCWRPAPPPHVWTPDHDSSDLPRLTSLLSRKPTALLRDRSNRLVGVIFGRMFVPCLDDGNLAESVPRVFEDLPMATVEEYQTFYAELGYPGLAITALVAKTGQEVAGFRVAAGTLVPATGGSGLPVEQVDAFPWERDALILPPADALAGISHILAESTASADEQAAEAYHYLRLSLGRWLNYDQVGVGFKEEINKLIASSKTLYVKRERMDILLESVVRNFLFVLETDRRRALPLLRRDCIPLDKDSCSTAEGSCVWVKDWDKCKIAVPKTRMDPVPVFTARLSDELLRYASGAEILENRVPTIRIPTSAIRVGDELFMATKKKEPTHIILERMGFSGQRPAAFPEEMLRLDGLEEEVAYPTKGIPQAWSVRGLSVPTVTEQGRALAWASGTGESIETWATNVADRRVRLGLPERPFTWSLQDMFAIASIKSSSIVYVTQKEDGSLVVTKLIRPPKKEGVAMSDMYILLWGPDELLVSSGNKYRFTPSVLPSDVMNAIDLATPISEAEIRGAAEPTVGPTVGPTVEPTAGPTVEPTAGPTTGIIAGLSAGLSAGIAGLTELVEETLSAKK